MLQRGQTDPEEILDVRNVGYDVLRLARVRLHAVECLLWRLFFHSQNVESVDLILFSDGSPQWRGVEMLASSFLIRIPGHPQKLQDKVVDSIDPSVHDP